MSFYGNIKNTARTQFHFDRIYPNRESMDRNAAVDGIFVGRFVLVEYEQDISADIFPQYHFYNGKMYTEMVTTKVRAADDNKVEINAVESGLKSGEVTRSKIKDGLICCVPAGQQYHLNTLNDTYIRFTDSKGAYITISSFEYDEFYRRNKNLKEPNIFIVDNRIYSEHPFQTGYCAKIQAHHNYTTSKELTYRKAKFKDGGETEILWNQIAEGESTFVKNWNIDKSNPDYERRTFDSTVWQKVYVGNKEQYVMIADLNTIKPTFTFTADAPTMTPVPIHYDVNNTNTNYNIHMQTPWGIRVKSANPDLNMPLINHNGQIKDKLGQVKSTDFDRYYPSDFGTFWKGDFYDVEKEEGESKFYSPVSQKWNGKQGNPSTYIPGAVYVNRNGFNPKWISKSGDLTDKKNPNYNPEIKMTPWDEISLMPTGYSGRMYNDHTGDETYKAQPDTQELVFMLPSLGDAVSNIWDIVYGGRDTDSNIKQTNNRNTDISWEFANGVVKRLGLRAIQEDGGFSTKKAETIAGCINSVHDLMGMIIVNDADNLDINSLDENYIYKFSDGSYKRKTVDYDYTKAEYTYKQIGVSPATYHKNEFYLLEGGTYKPCLDETFDINKTYYTKVVTPKEKWELVTNLVNKPNYPLFYKTPVNAWTGKSDYQVVKEVSEGVKYWAFSASQKVKVTAFYSPYRFYYYETSKKSYTLDTKESAIQGRGYVLLKPSQKVNQSLRETHKFNHKTNKYIIGQNPETGDNIEVPLTYIYSPGVFYKMERKQDGSRTLILEKRPWSQINTNDEYYIVWGRESEGDGQGTWVKDENGNWTTKSGTTNLVIEGFYRISLIPFIEDRYFYRGEILEYDPKGNQYEFEGETPQTPPAKPQEDNNLQNNKYVASYNTLTEEKLADIYKKEFTGNPNTAVFVDFYTLDTQDAGVFYAPNIFYYKTPDGSYCVDTNKQMTEGRDYFSSVTFSERSSMVFYVPYKYYVDDPITKKKVLDKTPVLREGVQYYKYNGDLFVISDSLNKIAPFSEWNPKVTNVPASVELGRRTEKVAVKNLDNFARQLNTIHGLILKVNKMLEIENYKTRDTQTIQGCINSVNDIINKFEELEPGKILLVDNYGRVNNADWTTLQLESSKKTKGVNSDLDKGIIEDKYPEVNSVAEMKGQWLTLHTDSTPTGPKIHLHHNFQKVKDTSLVTNKNIDGVASDKDSDKLNLCTPIVDAMGHVVGNNSETVTLPYGFKTINSNGSVDSVDGLAAAAHPSIIAESTQDTLGINVGNKWIKTSADAQNDVITFAHTLSPVSAQANQKFGLEQNETITLLDQDNTFEVPVFKFDEAGHITFAETHTVTIPEIFENVKIKGGSTDTEDTTSTDGTIKAGKLSDTLSLSAGNRWLQLSHDADTNTISFKHYVKKFTESAAATDLDNSNTFTVQEVAWDNAGHLVSSNKRTYTLQDGYKNVIVANSGSNTATALTPQNGTLVASSQVDSFTIDTGNRWIDLKADAANKKIVIAHGGPGVSVQNTGEAANKDLSFGDTFSVLSIGTDATGHVKDLAARAIKLPKNNLVDIDTGNIVTGLTLTPTSGTFTLKKQNVGELLLNGFSVPTAGSSVAIAPTDSINNAFNKTQAYLIYLENKIKELEKKIKP